ncbi:2-oxo acid dehydrogenase subunit E2 [Actinomadura barringtoniae]|uniref:2-oxo acid dehydrogenase subunit E2 n=1 Tax=Actinomadura barringtoniae TaxID=1427535 RepID=A0A939T768_9ACTN|nr:2-oxo acid dehydrogenase subunit E2 [Actinomadura barringtoniae]MBO2455751.1 2-oxo acid dehydrogenase subunit E2 [Actinomadura barringtoniae]
MDLIAETTPDEDVQVEKLSRVRKVIAARMHQSLQGSAQLTSVVEADFGPIMAARAAHGERFRAVHGVSLSPLAVVAAAVCRALPEHRMLNATIDTDAGTASYHRRINLGFAVDTEAGLMVPNLKDAGTLSVAGLAQGIAGVAGRARARKLRPDDIMDGTFTITNTGSRGSLLDTPILNAPETGILAVGKAERRPVVVGTGEAERVEIRDMAYLCLTYDHRLVDGADAARFLTALKDGLESRPIAAADLELEPGDE